MAWVERMAADVDVGAEAVQLLKLLAAIVAGFAEALQLTERKLVPVAAMRLDMVSHGCGRHQAALAAKPA